MPSLALPPGPKGSWLMGTLSAFQQDRLGYMTQLAEEYGDLAMVRFANVPILFINHPDLIEEVLVKQHRHFIKSRALRRSKPLLGEGLLTSEGDFWRRQRRLSQPAFHMRRIEAYSEAMVRYAEQAVSTWQVGEVRDLHNDMMHITLQIVSKTLFDHEVVDEADTVGAALTVALREWVRRAEQPPILDFLPSPKSSPWSQAIRQLDEIVYAIINQRRSSGDDRGDLLSMLLQAQDDDGSSMTDKQLRDEVMTLFLAGHETTANALSWTWYLLSQYPEVDQKLGAELAAVLGGRAPTLADLPLLPYTNMVITETMRLYPPAWLVSREAVADFEMRGYRFKKGTNVLMSQYTMHRHPGFFAEPDRFWPERWENGLAKQLPTYAYFPFGGGPRLCIGKSFAIMEAVLVLATLAQKFRADLAPGHPVEPEPVVTLRPKHGLQMVLQSRSR